MDPREVLLEAQRARREALDMPHRADARAVCERIDRALDAGETAGRLIDQLTNNHYRAVLRAYYLQGQTRAKIARDLGQTENSVRQAYTNAVRELREMQ